jgi:hypothetical protein
VATSAQPIAPPTRADRRGRQKGGSAPTGSNGLPGPDARVHLILRRERPNEQLQPWLLEFPELWHLSLIGIYVRTNIYPHAGISAQLARFIRSDAGSHELSRLTAHRANTYEPGAKNRGRRPQGPRIALATGAQRKTTHPWGEPWSERVSASGTGDADKGYEELDRRGHTPEERRERTFDRKEILTNLHVAGDLPGLGGKRYIVQATLPHDPRVVTRWVDAKPDAIAPMRRPWRIKPIRWSKTLCPCCAQYFFPVGFHHRWCARCHSGFLRAAHAQVAADIGYSKAGVPEFFGCGHYWASQTPPDVPGACADPALIAFRSRLEPLRGIA